MDRLRLSMVSSNFCVGWVDAAMVFVKRIDYFRVQREANLKYVMLIITYQTCGRWQLKGAPISWSTLL